MRQLITFAVAIAVAGSAQAQFGDLLKKIDPSKIKKGAEVVRQVSREFTEDEETDIGRIVSARILSTYPLAKNDRLQTYVTLVGNTVASYSSRPTLNWHFAVIETPIINAFSAPGGFIFITTGALDRMSSEAELAAVLGHEIAHATQKHILKEIRRSNTLSASLDLAQETSLADKLNNDLGRKLGDLAFEKLFTTGLSRRDEQEADKIGVAMAESAGYRPSEFLHFLSALEKIEGTSQMKVLVATHPRASDRAAALKPVLAKSADGVTLAERWVEWTQE